MVSLSIGCVNGRVEGVSGEHMNIGVFMIHLNERAYQLAPWIFTDLHFKHDFSTESDYFVHTNTHFELSCMK